MTPEETKIQLALGSMSRGDAFVEHIKRTLTPIPWPSTEEFHKVYPDLSNWMRQVDIKLGEIIEQFNDFFSDEEIDEAEGKIFIQFTVNTSRIGAEDWSEIATGDSDSDDEYEDRVYDIFKYLQIISPLMVMYCDTIRTINIEVTHDT